MEQTNTVAGIRFAFFFVQAICMIAMGILVAISATGVNLHFGPVADLAGPDRVGLLCANSGHPETQGVQAECAAYLTDELTTGPVQLI